MASFQVINPICRSWWVGGWVGGVGGGVSKLYWCVVFINID